MSGSLRCRRCSRLAARETERRVGEHGDRLGVALGGELGERAGEEVVAGRASRVDAVRCPQRRDRAVKALAAGK